MAIRHGDGRVEHAGCVVREMERNGYDDSDFYALVYDRFASCTDCGGSGWRDGFHEGARIYTGDHAVDYHAGIGYGNDTAKTEYEMILTLMDGVYESTKCDDGDERCRYGYRMHESVADRKYLSMIASYMGIGDRFGCETCGGTGKVAHADGGSFRWVEWGSTRWACDTYCSVDATDEVKALFKEWVEKNRIRLKAGLERIEATKLRKGRRVRVVRGRKIAHGTEGEVIWHGTDKYASRWNAHNEFARVGFRTDDGETHFTAGSNLEVIVDLTGDGDWVAANDLVMDGDSVGLNMTAEGWHFASGFAYVG